MAFMTGIYAIYMYNLYVYLVFFSTVFKLKFRSVNEPYVYYLNLSEEIQHKDEIILNTGALCSMSEKAIEFSLEIFSLFSIKTKFVFSFCICECKIKTYYKVERFISNFNMHNLYNT